MPEEFISDDEVLDLVDLPEPKEVKQPKKKSDGSCSCSGARDIFCPTHA